MMANSNITKNSYLLDDVLHTGTQKVQHAYWWI